MTISKRLVRAILALAAAVGLVLPTGFGPAWAVESPDANRGNGDQTQTQTATPVTPASATPVEAAPAPQALPTPQKPQAKLLAKATGPSRSGVRNGRIKKKVLVGTVSWYGGRFHGRRTYTGERFNMHAMTLASRRLPMGTRVRVTNLRTGKSAVARVNDFGPSGRFRHRMGDLSVGLARKIGFSPGQGTARVKMEVIN